MDKITTRGYYLFLGNLLIVLLISLAIHYLFLSNNSLYYQSFSQHFSLSRINQMLEISKKWQWVGYAIVPLVILLRVFYSSIFLYIGVFFTELKVDFGKLFKVALLADFVYVLAGLAKLVILIFFKEVSTLEDLQFSPLSVMELMNKNAVDPLFIHSLSLLNVFELGYFLVLAWLLAGVLNEANNEQPIKFGSSLRLVATSYGSGLLLWVILVMFITLNLS